jgi:hypothetical protein
LINNRQDAFQMSAGRNLRNHPLESFMKLRLSRDALTQHDAIIGNDRSRSLIARGLDRQQDTWHQ